MKRIALFAALALSALAAGDLRADDGCDCPTGCRCVAQGPHANPPGCFNPRCAAQRLPAGRGPSIATPPSADVCSSPPFPVLHAIAENARARREHRREAVRQFVRGRR